jgi:hypothetical protein
VLTLIAKTIVEWRLQNALAEVVRTEEIRS